MHQFNHIVYDQSNSRTVDLFTFRTWFEGDSSQSPLHTSEMCLLQWSLQPHFHVLSAVQGDAVC